MYHPDFGKWIALKNLLKPLPGHGGFTPSAAHDGGSED